MLAADLEKGKCVLLWPTRSTLGLVCMTQDPSSSPKDASNADGGKIRSALTLGVNCSIGGGGRGPCCNSEGRQKVRGGRKRGKEKCEGGRDRRMEGHALIERPSR